jgi:predicted nucleotidyltransferase
MVNVPILEEIKKRLIKVYAPQAIYLFGSYAWGNPTPDSDLDLIIIVPKSEEKSYKRSIVGDLALSDILVSRDIIVYTVDEFKERMKDVSTLCSKVVKEGKLLYGHI